VSWIRSDKAILNHPKIAHLKMLLKVDIATAIGRLHMLWWWCLDYAPDGDLSKQPGKVIEQACDIPIQTLIRSGLIDSRPYRRIHDWWDNQGAYLRSRYHKQPEIWQRIEKLYERDLDISKDVSQDISRTRPVRRTDVTDVTDVRNVRDVRTYVTKKEQNQSAGFAASPPPALTKVDETDMPEFDHEDFVKAGWINSERPDDADSFGWEHFNRAMTNEERVMSKTREKFYAQKKHWN
jgi:hypothetical protein